MCGAPGETIAACTQQGSVAGAGPGVEVNQGGGKPAAFRPEGADARAREAYRRAREWQARGDADGALALLWQASGLAPGDADIQTALAEALERVGALDTAIEAWRAALAARPEDRKASRGLVLALVAAGRSPEAVTLARAAAEAAPKDADALFTLGLAQSEQDVEAALATLRHVLARAPDHTLARYNLALLLNRVDRRDEAIAELMRVIALEARPEANYALGVAWWHRGEAARATAAFQATIALEPRHAEAYHKLGVVRAAERDWDGAAAALRRSLALRPDVPEVHVSLARVLSASGDEAGARAQLAEGERLRQESEREHEARVWTALGSARLEHGDAIAALDAFRRALAIRNTYAPAHFQMGRALERLGDADAAEGAYTRARQLNPRLVRGSRTAPERVP
ncbi:lipoprotein NlpI [Luteitalea pratensis]|uniref:Lipoprotein NlpI n=2 Tax=Luteitalea pratensis TaxID=1855912 RepID=A0A143PI68_LUTPR|nr:lipoprotein NlpI [Luteitalea pratensis]